MKKIALTHLIAAAVLGAGSAYSFVVHGPASGVLLLAGAIAALLHWKATKSGLIDG